jgi:hypothetical protein
LMPNKMTKPDRKPPPVSERASRRVVTRVRAPSVHGQQRRGGGGGGDHEGARCEGRPA